MTTKLRPILIWLRHHALLTAALLTSALNTLYTLYVWYAFRYLVRADLNKLDAVWLIMHAIEVLLGLVLLSIRNTRRAGAGIAIGIVASLFLLFLLFLLIIWTFPDLRNFG